jgi:hypothetical protein
LVIQIRIFDQADAAPMKAASGSECIRWLRRGPGGGVFTETGITETDE